MWTVSPFTERRWYLGSSLAARWVWNVLWVPSRYGSSRAASVTRCGVDQLLGVNVTEVRDGRTWLFLRMPTLTFSVGLLVRRMV